ncbi:hypothetical protein F5141DRAFT_1201834 [Pisolithus sp. B1]|nr:hypothetical protein F5141DRAFT_1201834 [Pisolithus sp. B1]
MIASELWYSGTKPTSVSSTYALSSVLTLILKVASSFLVISAASNASLAMYQGLKGNVLYTKQRRVSHRPQLGFNVTSGNVLNTFPGDRLKFIVRKTYPYGLIVGIRIQLPKICGHLRLTRYGVTESSQKAVFQIPPSESARNDGGIASSQTAREEPIIRSACAQNL